jgi:valyl-tRNA synthetase
MDKSFEPAAIESKWYAEWEAKGLFKPAASGEPYCILLPPPNVTGTLHMGHAFQQTIMDALTRYHRMRGFRTLWQGGTDHAGIATQKIVENQLATLGQSRHDLGRDAFIERVWDWKEQSGSTITNQMRRLGASVDWSRERFTMDAGLSAAVRRVFVTWYRDGLIYRGKRLVHWDPVLMTAVSDLEVNNEEKEGSLWSIRYNVIDPHLGEPDHIVVATTRPETMLGDVAVAVHPDDERYAVLVHNHRQLMLPLAARPIPVIADDYVDREFGTGAVKITPAHDFNDYQVWLRNEESIRAGIASANRWPTNWALFSILSLDGKIVNATNNVALVESHKHGKQVGVSDWPGVFIDQLVPSKYQGLDRFVARKAVLTDLDALDLLVETKKHKLQVPISQRSDAVIEPMLTDQWFLDLTRDTLPDGRPGGRKAITEPALAAVRDGAIKFVPENWASTYNQWLQNIQDWCVSRQLWWGHQIPAWYDEADTIFVGEDEADARAHATTPPVGALRQDADVLDTWFSSALWPFSTMGWPGETPKRAAEWKQFKTFMPSNVLVTGFDIIFFWVARMVMATQYFTGQVPFREVYINAIVRDAEGQKMSKSKGNTIDPLDVIDGIALDTLVRKSTASLLIPQVRDKVEKRIRKDYPDGIAPIGADALRFTFAALATYGRTINFDLKRADGYRNFCTKLWNAARFVLMNASASPLPSGEGGAIAPGEGSGARGAFNPAEPSSGPSGHLLPEGEGKTEAERWILTRLHHTLAEVEAHFTTYRFDLIAQALYEFVWNDYCDWFLELAKPALSGNDQAAADSTRRTLLIVLEAVLRALHPIIPFITEEIWHEVAPKLGIGGSSVSTQTYPRADDFAVDGTADAEVEWLKSTVGAIRKMRSENNIAPSTPISVIFDDGKLIDHKRAGKFESAISFLAKANGIRFLSIGEEPPPFCALVVDDELAIRIPLDGLVNRDAEIARLEKERTRLDAEVKRAKAKLANANFIANAPADVVEQEKERINRFSTELARINLQIQHLRATGAKPSC